jgi:hypothetical protein
MSTQQFVCGFHCIHQEGGLEWRIPLACIQLEKRVCIVVIRVYEPCMKAYQGTAPSQNVPKFFLTNFHLPYGNNTLFIKFIL